MTARSEATRGPDVEARIEDPNIFTEVAEKFSEEDDEDAPKYRMAPEVEDLAKIVIREHHPHLEHASIGYMFRDTSSWRSKGKSVRGKAYKVGGWKHVATGWDFLIMIYLPAWEGMPQKTRRALIDHELSHCWYDEESDEASIISHDIEAFHGVIERHGAWKPELERLQQLTLFR